MSKFDDFDVDVDSINEGRWVPVYITARDGESLQIEIHTRGLTDKYTDAQARMMREAARGFNGETEKLPVSMRRKINIECFIKHVLLDPPVRGLFHDEEKTKPVTGAEFIEKIRSPKGQKFTTACFQASKMLDDNLVEDVEAAAKN